MRKRERIDRMGRERTNIVERWSETESEGERAIVEGTLGVEERDNNDDRQSERARLSYQEGDGIRGTRRDTALRSLR